MPRIYHTRTESECIDAFWKKVDKRGPGECWLWTDAVDSFGYGRMNVLGKQDRSHRISFRFVNGPISKGLHIMHSCDNPRCCNPSHLSAGTAADNMADKAKKGRAPKPPCTKATSEVVLYIREQRAAGRSLEDISEEVGISSQQCCAISRGRMWKEVGGPIMSGKMFRPTWNRWPISVTS